MVTSGLLCRHRQTALKRQMSQAARQHVIENEVNILDDAVIADGGRHVKYVMAQRLQTPAIESNEANRRAAMLIREDRCVQHVGRIATCRDRDEHVGRFKERFQLVHEDLVITSIVCQRCQRRDVVRERHRP